MSGQRSYLQDDTYMMKIGNIFFSVHLTKTLQERFGISFRVRLFAFRAVSFYVRVIIIVERGFCYYLVLI